MDDLNKFSQSECEELAMAAFKRHDYSTAKDILSKELKAAQLSRQLQPWLIDLVHNLAAASCLERCYDEAEYLYTNGLIVRETILGPNHPFTVGSTQALYKWQTSLEIGESASTP